MLARMNEDRAITTTLFSSTNGAIFECTPGEGKAACLHRFTGQCLY
jgi:hypothetical protein